MYFQASKENSAYDQAVSHLRGGTPFELYQWPYYVSIAHATFYKDRTHHVYYTMHLVVLSVEPYRIVYMSNPLQLNSTVFQNIPLLKDHSIKDNYFYPTTLVIENADSFVVGGHINDHSSVLVRFKGLRALMTQMMTSDAQRYKVHGPPTGFLQRHIHDMTENVTGLGFVHTRHLVPGY